MAEFDNVHHYLATQQVFLGVEESIMGIWMPTQTQLIRDCGGGELASRIMPAGATSAEASVRLAETPSLTFVISERPAGIILFSLILLSA